MREIKFRAYDTTNKEMMNNVCLVGRHIVFEFKSHGYDLDELDITYLDILDGKNEYEIMQYTESLDKNGVEIYEGDIVEHPIGIRAKIKYIPEHSAFLAHYIEDDNAKYDYLDNVNQCEVIGNIYENPELV